MSDMKLRARNSESLANISLQGTPSHAPLSLDGRPRVLFELDLKISLEGDEGNFRWINGKLKRKMGCTDPP